MPTMVLRFPGGRYHATPGGHHVNEGIVEWPPSPYRIVRALLACGYSTQHWDVVPPAGRRLVESLSSSLPVYRLPRAALGHSRHYMPTTKLKRDREETTLVLDTFADVGEGIIWVRWPTNLDDDAQQLFGTLVTHLGYLGRSESWVVCESVPDEVPLPDYGPAFPHLDSERAEQGFQHGFEQTMLNAPELPHDYSVWRQLEVDAAIRDIGIPDGKKATAAQQKKIDAIQRVYPVDLVDSLQRDTAWWQGLKWSRALGLRPVLYWREANALEVGPPASPRRVVADRVEMMLLALTTPSGSMTALPPVTRTLPQAEVVHRALISKLGFGGDPCPELVGRDARGKPLEGHRHAHILPLDLDGDGRLDHVVIFAPMGLGRGAQRAVRALRKTYMKGGVGELRVALAGAGTLDDLRLLGAGLGTSVDKLLGPSTGSASWVSATPLVPPRHVKKTGSSSLAGQIAAELSGRGYPRATVEVLEWGEARAFRHFVRRRQRGPQPPLDCGFAIRLFFESPVRGPIGLGYGCHFGLGSFRAMQP